MSDEITFDDCGRLILEQGLPDRAYADPDKPDYRRDLLALLNKEFGIRWQDTDDLTPRDRRVPAIAPSLVRHNKTITDPFSEWFEYAPVGRDGGFEGAPAAHRRCGGNLEAMLCRVFP
jgi:hypothetical protein